MARPTSTPKLDCGNIKTFSRHVKLARVAGFLPFGKIKKVKNSANQMIVVQVVLQERYETHRELSSFWSQLSLLHLSAFLRSYAWEWGKQGKRPKVSHSSKNYYHLGRCCCCFHFILADRLLLLLDVFICSDVYCSNEDFNEVPAMDSYSLSLTPLIATNSFSSTNKLGQGVFGAVYKVIKQSYPYYKSSPWTSTIVNHVSHLYFLGGYIVL